MRYNIIRKGPFWQIERYQCNVYEVNLPERSYGICRVVTYDSVHVQIDNGRIVAERRYVKISPFLQNLDFIDFRKVEKYLK